MAGETLNTRRSSSWSRTLVRATLISGGAVAILLPAWLPNRGSAPIERGTVELMQAFLLAASAAVMLGASSHAGYNRPVCRVIAMILLGTFIAEIEDFISGILKLKFPEAWVSGIILLVALVTALRHRRVMVHFISTLGNHAGSGFIGAALLIIYVFNRVIGSAKFWKATLGASFSPEIPKICKGYLELLGCYLIFVGILGLSITLARRKEPM
ncbi:MAG: hypothetical protein V4689_16860 [Verrucomicrobiota bacterium]